MQSDAETLMTTTKNDLVIPTETTKSSLKLAELCQLALVVKDSKDPESGSESSPQRQLTR